MTLQEFQERSKDIVDAAIEGQYHEATVDLISDVMKDYEQMMNAPDNGWQEKYMKLKEKYIERFFGGGEENSDIIEESVEEKDVPTNISTDEIVEKLMED